MLTATAISYILTEAFFTYSALATINAISLIIFAAILDAIAWTIADY